MSRITVPTHFSALKEDEFHQMRPMMIATLPAHPSRWANKSLITHVRYWPILYMHSYKAGLKI